jgi:chromosome segregation ATPase
MEHDTSFRTQRFAEITKELWALRTEVNDCGEELRSLRRTHHVSELQLLQIRTSLRDIARAAGALHEEIAQLYQEQESGLEDRRLLDAA